ncbi:dihydrolipoamide dehydrogenase [Aquamicrobium lusatiense]|uniref:Dihydrolipoyl dehydrogenase n=1 Tax=Aquamicrobium lusatiense TaxID=89772 RepID=A0A7W9S0P3_9HYPH|nr:dihydrolipoyl dehydrogenase [Aquamicrobium lusatiense]MBB6011219.1 dihydrolipoamide dehydrogenase [Aquamicrobium lusatiense]
MKDISCKLLVIGAGPGGYVCAIRAGQLGIDTVIVEAAKPGGTCLNVGCIPSKALIHAAEEFEKAKLWVGSDDPLGISVKEPALDFSRTIGWKDSIVGRLNSGVAGLLKKARVKYVQGRARFRDGKTVEVETEIGQQIIRAENVVIATGSAPVELPSLPFGGQVISSTEALSLKSVPQRLAVVGGGYIGLELGTAFAKLGAKVTIVEALPRILAQYDAELVRPVSKRLAALGIDVLVGAKAKGMSSKGDALLVETAEGKDRKIAADKVLVTVGRRPVTEGWGLEEIDLDMNGRFIRIDDRCRTSMRGIYAIGDVTGEPMLAHRAMAQGEMVAEIVAGHRRSWDKRAIPAICFTDPELVTAGLSPDEAKAQGEIKIGQFPFSANGRAMTRQGEDGFVRVVARADNHLVLGIQAVGQGVSELSAAFGLALEMGARLEDIAGTIHAHPTQGEAFQEAALKALGLALHA